MTKFPKLLMNQPPNPAEKPARRHHRRKHRLEDAHRPNFFRKAETILSRHLFVILGVVFILASIVYAATSAEKLFSYAKTLSSHGKMLHIDAPAAAVTPAPEAHPANPAAMMPWIVLLVIASALLIWVSYRFHRREIPRALVIVFHASVLLIALNFNWPVHIIFPVVILFSAALYMNAIHLRSTLPYKANVILAWAIAGIWWLAKLILPGDVSMLLPYFIYIPILFLVFTATGMYKGFRGTHRSSYYTEMLVTMINLLAFVVFTSITLLKFGYGNFLWLLVLAVALMILAALYLTDRLKSFYNPEPYLLSALVLLSLAMPLLLVTQAAVLFFGGLSVMLLAYARFTGRQYPVIVSLGALAVMFLFYLRDWILVYGPAVFQGPLGGRLQFFAGGLIAGIVVFAVLLAVHALLKQTETGFSKKWFSRRVYLRMFRGLMLGVAYLSGLWISGFLAATLSGSDDLYLMTWILWSSLYFCVTIPVLARKKSSFLRPFLWISLMITIAYPGLVHLDVLGFRNHALQYGTSMSGFWLHYPVLVMMFACLVITSVRLRPLLKDQPVVWQVIQGYVILMGLFILLSELDNIRLITGIRPGIRRDDILLANTGLPYTVVLLSYSSLILAAGLIRRSRFLRTVALVLLVLTFAKILYRDAGMLGATGRTIMLFAFGTLILAGSVFYPRIRRIFRSRGHVRRKRRTQ
jgi:hypothetical protein